jgi:hypothetical protein
MDPEWIVQRITDPFEEGGVFFGKLTYRKRLFSDKSIVLIRIDLGFFMG